MTDTATGPARGGHNGALRNRALRNRALGAYGERVAARHLTDQGMVVLDRNWRCDEGELDLVLRDGPVLVGCEVKTRTSLAHGSPHEAVTDAKLARLRRLVAALAARPRGPSCRDPGRPGRGAATPAGTSPGGARAGDRLMPVASTPTIALDGAVGHLVDVQADVSQGQAGLTLVGRSDVSLNEAPHRCRMAVHNTNLLWPASRRITILLSPSDLPKRGTHFDLAIALAVLKADGSCPSHRPGRLGLHRGAHPQRRAPIGPRRAADGAGGRPAGDPPGVRRRAAGTRGRDGARHDRVRACARWARWSPSSPERRCPRPRRWRRCPAARCCPGGVRSASTRSTWPTCTVWRRPATPSRSPPPVDTTSFCPAPRAVARPRSPSGSPACYRTSRSRSRSRSRPSIRWRARSGRATGLIRRPPFSAPHHDASKASILGGGSGRVRPGEVSRAHCGVLLLDEFPLLRTDVIDALRQPLESGEVTIARRRGVGHLSGAGDRGASRPTPARAATTGPMPGATAAPAVRSQAS